MVKFSHKIRGTLCTLFLIFNIYTNLTKRSICRGKSLYPDARILSGIQSVRCIVFVVMPKAYTQTYTLSVVHFLALEALKIQNQCSFGRSAKHFTSMCMQLMMVFDASQIANQLKVLLHEQTGINWPATLTFTATFLVCFSGSSVYIQGTYFQ